MSENTQRGPNLKKLGELRSEHWRNGNGLLRIHHTLTSQAQCLLDWHKEYGMNGQGVKIGKYKLLVRKLKGDSNAKAYVLTKDNNFREDDNANAFIVRTDPQGEISEIIQCSKRSGHSLRLVPSNDDIFDRAELWVTNKKEKQKFMRETEPYANLIDLFAGDSAARENIARKIDEIAEQFLDCEQSYTITVPQEDEQTKEAKNILLKGNNLYTLGAKLRLLGRPNQEGIIPLILSEFYRYTELKPGQISFAFYRGGVNSTQVIGEDGKTQCLRCFGPPDSRRRFYSSGDNVYVIKDDQLEEFMKGIGVDVTTDNQNKAIYRWTLLQNEVLLNKLGIYVEKNPNPKEAEILHLVCPSGRTLLRDLKINIPIGVASMYKTTIMTFPKTPVLKKLQEVPVKSKPGGDSKEATERRPQFDSIEMFHKLLEEIGFKIASPLRTEAFIEKTLKGAEAKTMREFLQARIKFKPEVYRSELGTVLLEKYLTDEGYENIERINKGSGGNATILLKCSQGDNDYLARVLTHKGNKSAKERTLCKFANEEKRKPLLFMIEETDDLKRTRGPIVQLAIKT